MRVFEVKEFKRGTVNNIIAKDIGSGAASDSLNWLTLGDHIELRRGYKVVGTENAGVGRVTGIHVSKKVNGTTLPLYSYLRKLKYYDSTTTDWVEIGSDSLPAAASDEDVYFASYTSLAGYQTMISSPNSSYYKLMNANPGTLTDVFNSTAFVPLGTKSLKGKIRIINGRTVLWGRATEKANPYLSHIDLQNAYTAVTGEAYGTGDGVTLTFTHTAAFKAGGSRRTAFGFSVTDGVETFSDGRNGILTGSAGGAGTINYATGATSVTFAVAPLNLAAITTAYFWEDTGSSGLSDFSYTLPTRVAADGLFLQQGVGGDLLENLIIKDNIYSIHSNAAWYINLSIDDLSFTNKLFRERLGLSNARGAVATGDGIFYIDVTYPAKPNFSLLRYNETNPEVEPYVYSYNVLLEGFILDDLTTLEYGDFILYSMKSSSDATANDTTFVYNKQWKTIDRLDYGFRCGADNNGLLWVGDSLSTNVLELFSEFDDNDSLIDNYWIGDISETGIDYLKKFKRLDIEGYITASQNVGVYISYDQEDFTLIGTISGTGDYVDANDSVLVGASGIGINVVGGGSDGTSAYHYIAEFRVRSDKYRTAQIKFVATGVGYVTVSQETFYDVKTYGQKQINRYRAIS